MITVEFRAKIEWMPRSNGSGSPDWKWDCLWPFPHYFLRPKMTIESATLLGSLRDSEDGAKRRRGYSVLRNRWVAANCASHREWDAGSMEKWDTFASRNGTCTSFHSVPRLFRRDRYLEQKRENGKMIVFSKCRSGFFFPSPSLPQFFFFMSIDLTVTPSGMVGATICIPLSIMKDWSRFPEVASRDF